MKSGNVRARRKIGGDLSCDEVSHALSRGYEFAAALPESLLLYALLEVKDCQRAMLVERGQLFFFHAHHDTGVGIGVITFGRGPAIDHQFVCGGGGRSDDTSGAHAKREYPFMIHLFDKTVGGGWKISRYSGTILYGIDEVLWMFDADA